MAAHYSSLSVEALNCRVLNCLICVCACEGGSLVAGQIQDTARQRERRREVQLQEEEAWRLKSSV